MKVTIAGMLIFSQLILAALRAGSISTDISLGMGYRCDNLGWTVNFSPLSNIEIEEKWKDIQVAQVSGKIETCVNKNLYLRAEGDYGFILNGNKSFDLRESDDSCNGDWLRANTYGDVYDISGAIGYLTSPFFNRIRLNSLLGYACLWQHFHDEQYSDCIYLLNLFEGIKSSYAYRWVGPWIGFCLTYDYKAFKCSFEYQIHNSFYYGRVFDNLMDAEKEIQEKKSIYGNSFMLNILFPKWKSWGISLIAKWQLYKGRNGKNSVNEETVLLKNIDWRSSSLSLEIIRSF